MPRGPTHQQAARRDGAFTKHHQVGRSKRLGMKARIASLITWCNINNNIMASKTLFLLKINNSLVTAKIRHNFAVFPHCDESSVICSDN